MIKSISKILSDNKTLILSWTLYALSPVVEMIRYRYNFWILSENSQFVFILNAGASAYVWLFLILSILIMTFWYKNLVKINYLKFKHYLTLALVVLITVLLEIIIRFILSIDQSHYQNYIFSTYGVKPELLKIMSVVNYLFTAMIIAMFASIYERKIKKTKKLVKNLNKNDVNLLNINTSVNVFSFVVLIFMSMYPFISIPNFLIKSKQTYTERLGREYVYIEALSNLTPHDSVVVHPPQSKEWPLFGNQPINRYFLFPRTLVSGKLINDNEYIKKFGEIYFVQVSETDTSPLWPKIFFDEKEIIFDMHNKVKFSEIKEIGQFSGKQVYKLSL